MRFLMIGGLLLSGVVWAAKLVDSRGRSFNIPKPAKRIASLCLAADEILLELGASRRIIALSTIADQPKFSNVSGLAKKIKHRVGDNLETVVGLKPDFVILAPYNRDSFSKVLTTAKIPNFMLRNVGNLDDLKFNILSLGQISGFEKKAAKLIEEIDLRIKNLKPLKKKPRVLNIGASPSTVAGEGTTIDLIIKLAGGLNAVTQKKKLSGWAQLNDEAARLIDADVVLASSVQETKIPFWSHLSAIKKQEIVAIDGPLLYSVTHHLIKAAEQLNEALAKKY